MHKKPHNKNVCHYDFVEKKIPSSIIKILDCFCRFLIFHVLGKMKTLITVIFAQLISERACLPLMLISFSAVMRKTNVSAPLWLKRSFKAHLHCYVIVTLTLACTLHVLVQWGATDFEWHPNTCIKHICAAAQYMVMMLGHFLCFLGH